MLLTILAYAMIIVFMYVVMKKKMSPFTALIIVPLVAVIIVILTNSANFTADKSFVEFLGGDKISHNLTAIGPMYMELIIPLKQELCFYLLSYISH